MSDRRIKGDTQPLEYQLKWSDGTPIDLRTAISVYLIMREDDGTTDKINAAAVITDAENGKVIFNFTSEQVSSAGMFKYRYLITFSGGKLLSVPSDDVLWLYIIDPTWM